MTARRSAKRAGPDVFRPLKEGDRVDAVYLFHDGHCVVKFSRYIEDVRRSLAYLKQAETIGLRVNFHDDDYNRTERGRVMFWGQGVVALRAMLAAGTTRLDCFANRETDGLIKKYGTVDFETPQGTVSIQRGDDVNAWFFSDPTRAEAFDPDAHSLSDLHNGLNLTIVETIRSAA